VGAIQNYSSAALDGNCLWGTYAALFDLSHSQSRYLLRNPKFLLLLHFLLIISYLIPLTSMSHISAISSLISFCFREILPPHASAVLPSGKDLRYPLNRMLNGPQNRYRRLEKRTLSCPCWDSTLGSFSPKSSHYNDNALPAPILTWNHPNANDRTVGD